MGSSSSKTKPAPRYIGDTFSIVDNTPHGHGQMEYPDGSIYIGQWFRGKKHGFGKIIYPDCSVYDGRWCDDYKHGQGKMTYADGSQYEGQWAYDAPFNSGTYHYTNGDVYEGQFMAGKRNGKGKMIFRGGFVCDGEWTNDLFTGYGTQRDNDFNVYSGNWRLGKKHGNMLIKFNRPTSSGIVKTEGEWLNDKKHGNFIIHMQDGTIIEQLYINGDEVLTPASEDDEKESLNTSVLPSAPRNEEVNVTKLHGENNQNSVEGILSQAPSVPTTVKYKDDSLTPGEAETVVC